MTGRYAQIVRQNLGGLDPERLARLARWLPARREDDALIFSAFGRRCRLSPAGIELDGRPEQGVLGILISLYALNVGPEPLQETPLKAYKEFAGSMPYAGAFVSHTESILVPHVAGLMAHRERLCRTLCGGAPPAGTGGDAAFAVRPLPKIGLCYILYAADEDFPASATCLFSANADRFVPLDALADVGEYTSRRLIELLQAKTPIPPKGP